MKIGLYRRLVQHVSFLVLMYGGRVGIFLGPAVPCFACPYVAGCGGYCYLMGLQGFIGLGVGFASMTSLWLFKSLGWLLVFILLVGVLGKLWCGWVCPFGLVQDWLAMLRKKVGRREMTIPEARKKKLSLIKYGLLAYLVILPPLVTAGILPEDFYLPFCNICPGKSLLPLFIGETRYLALNLNNGITFFFSSLLLMITGGMVVGMFFKERFFCLFCPMLALIHLLKPLTFLRLVKKPVACIGCGNCRRVCPTGVEKIYQEKISHDVQTDDCINCLRCVESCASDSALGLKFININLCASSRAYASDNRDLS